MRCAALLFCISILGCDQLWAPECTVDPELPNCAVAYQAVPKYIINSASQSWVLTPNHATPPADFKLSTFFSQIETKIIYGTDGNGATSDPSYVSPLDPDQLFLSLDREQFSAPIFDVRLRLGAASPQRLNLSGADLRCGTQAGLLNLGASQDGSTTDWGGLRQRGRQGSFLIGKSLPGDVGATVYESWSQTPQPMAPQQQGWIQLGCQLVATKNFAIQFCPTQGRLMTAAGQSSFRCNPKEVGSSYDLACPVPGGRVLGASAIDDVVALLEPATSKIRFLSLYQDQTMIGAQTISMLPTPEISVFSLNDIDLDQLSDAIVITQSGDVLVYLQRTSGEFAYSLDYSTRLQSALGRLKGVTLSDIQALTLGRVVSDMGPDLIVAARNADGGTDLAMLSLDPRLGPLAGLRSDWPAPGTALLGSPFAEPAVRLELADLNGDGHLDLTYVSASTVHFCTTQVAPR